MLLLKLSAIEQAGRKKLYNPTRDHLSTNMVFIRRDVHGYQLENGVGMLKGSCWKRKEVESALQGYRRPWRRFHIPALFVKLHEFRPETHELRDSRVSIKLPSEERS